MTVFSNMRALVFTLAISGLFLLPANEVQAQPDRGEDTKPENLQVLPENMSMQQVRRIMFRFNDALGVRCNYCHVGEAGQPLDTYDFVSDDKETKEVARAMLRMSNAINGEHMQQMPGDGEREAVNCTTCHRGVPIPKPLENVLVDHFTDNGADETLVHYNTLRDRYYGSDAYNFQEGTLNNLALELLSADEVEAALVFLDENLKHFPDSPDAHVLKGEAYAAQGDTEAAIQSLEKAVELNPRNRRAAQRLAQLKGENE